MSTKSLPVSDLLQYQDKLKSFIGLRVTEKEAVEEIFQETLISAFNTGSIFRGKSQIFTWLCGIAKHEISDYFRKRKIKEFLFSRLPWVENLASQALGPEQVYLKKELAQGIAVVFKKLDKKHVEVLQLKYIQGLSITEISEKLNETEKTIESRLFRARKAFAKVFTSNSR